MKTRDLVAIGIPAGPCTERAQRLLQQAQTDKRSTATVLGDLKQLARAPEAFIDDERYRELAQAVLDHIAAGGRFQAREGDAPYRIWGSDFEPQALQQMKNACTLPVAVSGALMPDAHVGYGLPIGGVLATRDAVIPYA